MPVPFNVHSSLGALYVGMVLATSLHGISMIQAWYYYTHQNDKWGLKSLVAAVMVCDTLHQIMIAHAVYIYTITNWGNQAELLTLVRSLVLATLFNGLTTFLVQSFMTMRLWRLSNHNILILIVTALIVLAQFGASIAFTILAIQRNSLVDLIFLKPLTYAMIVIAAVGDVLIAAALCVVLHLSRTGFQRSDGIINKLIVFTVHTGLLTSLYAIAAFIAYMTAPHSFIYIAFTFCLGRLYTNALLATLNGRKMIRNSSDNADSNTSDRVTLSLHDLAKSGATSRRGAPNISISVNTTKEFVTELMHGEGQDDDKDKITYSQTESSTGFEEKDRNV